jgi:hypothetical protein
MVTDDLRDYIKKVKDSGKSLDEIREALSKRGWKEEDIQEAFIDLGYEKASSKKSAKSSDTSSKPFVDPDIPPVAPSDTQTASPLDPKGVYPTLVSKQPTNPQRFWAVPILGGLVKIIILIPVYIELLLLSAVAGFMVFVINPFVVLFTGKYHKFTFDFQMKVLRLSTKVMFYMFGLTDKYPGFGLTIEDTYSLDMAYPEHPNRFFAIPLIGILVRYLFMIPFMIYTSVVYYAAWFGALGGSFVVLFKGRYPESVYELAVDAARLNLSMSTYFLGFSDSYPSSHISMNHKKIKIFLIVLSVIFLIFYYGVRFVSGFNHQKDTYNPYTPTQMNNYNYPTTYPSSYPSTYPSASPSSTYTYPSQTAPTVPSYPSRAISPTSPYVYPSVSPSPTPLPGF